MKVATSILATTVALCGMSMADDLPVVTMTMPGVKGLVDTFEFQGSVVGAGPDGTTMVIECEPKTNAVTTALDDFLYCELWDSATFMAGPSTYSMAVHVDNTENLYTHHVECDIQSTTHAVCTATEVFATTITATEYQGIPARTMTTDELGMVPVTITAGAEKLTAAPTVDGSEPTGTESTGAESTGAESTGGAPRITDAAHWAIGGMAAVALAAAV